MISSLLNPLRKGRKSVPPKVPPHLAMNVAVGGRPGPASGTPISALGANFRSAAKNVEPLSLSPQSLPTGAPAGYGERDIAPVYLKGNGKDPGPGRRPEVSGEAAQNLRRRDEWAGRIGAHNEAPPPQPSQEAAPGLAQRAGKAMGDARAAIGERFRKARIGLENGPVADAVAGAQGKVEGVGRKVRDAVRDRRAAQAAKNAPAPPSAAIPETFSDPAMAPPPPPPSLVLNAPPPSIVPSPVRSAGPSSLPPSSVAPPAQATPAPAANLPPPKVLAHINAQGSSAGPATVNQAPRSGAFKAVASPAPAAAGGTQLSAQATPPPAPAAAAAPLPPPPPAAGPVSQGPKTVQRAVNQAEMTWNQPNAPAPAAAPQPQQPQQVMPASPGLRNADGSLMDRNQRLQAKGNQVQAAAVKADQAARGGAAAPVAPQGGNLMDGPVAAEEAAAASAPAEGKEIKNKKPEAQQQEQAPAGPGWSHYIPHALGAAGLGIGGKMLYDSFHDGDEKRSSVDVFLSNYKPLTQPQQKVAAPSARSFLEMIR